MATRSGADTLLIGRRELMFRTLMTEQVARIGTIYGREVTDGIGPSQHEGNSQANGPARFGESHNQ